MAGRGAPRGCGAGRMRVGVVSEGGSGGGRVGGRNPTMRVVPGREQQMGSTSALVHAGGTAGENCAGRSNRGSGTMTKRQRVGTAGDEHGKMAWPAGELPA